MKKLSIGKMLISLVAIWSAFGSYVFDWNVTHIFNANWPPHAKFHNAQTMLLGTVIGISSFVILWSKSANNNEYSTNIASLLASFYWITQMGSLLFPGTALIDPEFKQPGMLPAQLIVDAVMLTVLSVGYLLERRRITQN